MRGRFDWFGIALVTFLGYTTSYYMFAPLFKDYADGLEKAKQTSVVDENNNAAQEQKLKE